MLQSLIATYPDLLAGEDDLSERTRLVLIEREVSIADSPDAAGRWSLDHLFVDQDGVPTLVEVKRSSDTRIRREVVGQMLEYAANGPRYWPPGSVRAHFEARCSREGDEPEEVLQRTFGGELAVEAWWTTVDLNLREGRLRLLFVADEISQELKAIIEFLNEQMVRTTVLGVELPQFADEAGSHRMFVPVMIGLSERAESVKSVRKRRWTREEWLERHEELAEPEDVAVTRQLVAWADSRDVDVAFGTAMNNPSMKFERRIGGRSLGVVRLYTDGAVEINFGHLPAPFNDLAGWRQLAERLEQIDGLKIPPERLGRFPTFPSRLLRHEEQLARFTETMEWAFGEMERATTDQSANDGIASLDAGSGADQGAT
ncbi:MAG: hypothetical protein M3387_14740 [Actinomycetota bacterium]|nr:hypothetical protein [Actinomycetota bacterium]